MPRKGKNIAGRDGPGGDKRKAGSRNSTEDLLRRLAHELRTPIGAIISRAEVMRDEKFGPLGDEIYHSYAETIHNSANHALAVVMHALREFAGDDQELTNDEVDLSELVEQCAAMVEPAAADAGVTLQIELAPAPLSVATYRTELTQIVLNVLINAIKFTPRSGIVEVATSVKSQGDAIICVRDNGVGIGPAELSRLKSAEGEGGFGFELSRRLAERCGCDIEIESDRGTGTSVCIIFRESADDEPPTMSES